jgi:hypothetical protein
MRWYDENLLIKHGNRKFKTSITWFFKANVLKVYKAADT